MWQAIISLIGGPVISNLLTAYNSYLKNQTADTKIAADLAAKQIAAETQLRQAEIGHAWEVEKLFAYVALAYYAKCVVWDTMLGFGVTKPLHGDISMWSGVIITWYFGKAGLENVARILKR